MSDIGILIPSPEVIAACFFAAGFIVGGVVVGDCFILDPSISQAQRWIGIQVVYSRHGVSWGKGS